MDTAMGISSSKPKQLLIFSWEYPGVNSISGAALSRRIGQVAEGFAEEGWKVTIVHRDHIGEKIDAYKSIQISDSIRRFPIEGPGINSESRLSRISLFRKLATFYYILFKGDRSFKWSKKVEALLKSGAIKKPDLIIGFYSPRGPLLAAHYAKNYFNVPWFADLQDPLSDGGKKSLGTLNFSWSRKILKSANLVTHVSPEWASESSKILNKEVESVRHAVPLINENISFQKSFTSYYLLYAGSLNSSKQSPVPLLKALNAINQSEDNTTIKLKLACSELVYQKFLKDATDLKLPKNYIEWLGWLNPEELNQAYRNADCLVLIPWETKDRIVVPSKLYEYMAFHKPILLAGPDSGAISSLLKEWEHSDVICNTEEKIQQALTLLYKRDTTLLLERKRCHNILETKDLAKLYISRYQRLFK